MANTLRVKRRTSGATGAPAALKAGEIAYNNMDGVLYIGFGDDGGGNATSIKAFAKDNFNPSVTYQAQDNDLDAIAALAGTGFLSRTASNTWAQRNLAGTAGRITVGNGDGIAGNPTIDLATVTVGGVVTGGSTKFTVDTYGRITNAGQASLSDLSAPTADVAFGGFKLTGVATPTTATDAANKQYVDNAIMGLDAKASVRVATTANQALSGGVAFPTIDSVTVAAGDRVLLMNQTTTAQNGIYVVGGTAGAWTFTRATDMNSWANVPGSYTFVEVGSANGDKGFVSTADAGGTLDTTAITFTQFNGAGTVIGGNGLTATGNTLDVNTGAGITITTDAVALAGQALALHNVTTAADQLIYATGASTFAATAFTSFGRSIVGGANAAAVQTTLGLVPGTNVQAQNANLSALAGLTGAADTLGYFTGVGTMTTTALTATGRSIIGAASPTAARVAIGAVIGTDVQAQNANLAALSGLTGAADTMNYFTGVGTMGTTSLTTTGRAIIGGANAGAVRTTLGLVIGTDVQAFSTRTANEQALTIATADNIILYGAANAAAVYQLGATGKALMGAATAGAAQTTLGLGNMALQAANAVAITGGTIDGITLDGGTF